MSVIFYDSIKHFHMFLISKPNFEKSYFPSSFCWSFYSVIIGIYIATFIIHRVLETPLIVDTKGVNDTGCVVRHEPVHADELVSVHLSVESEIVPFQPKTTHTLLSSKQNVLNHG